MLKSFRKLALALAVTTTFGVSASPASAAIVRTAAGVLQPGHYQTEEDGPLAGTFWSRVRVTGTNQLVCESIFVASQPNYCTNWYVYTVTGNGWEVTNP
jgi:hypothetical protein